jgi:hypothetical protein
VAQSVNDVDYPFTHDTPSNRVVQQALRIVEETSKFTTQIRSGTMPLSSLIKDNKKISNIIRKFKVNFRDEVRRMNPNKNIEEVLMDIFIYPEELLLPNP